MLESLVSVVIPLYNAEQFLSSGYGQIRKQTYKNLEIIFIDNNSTDDTKALLYDLQHKDPRVKVYSEKTQGAGAARNLGIRKSNGNLIAFFDIDDVWTSDRIERHVSIFAANPEVELVFSKMEKYYEEDPGKSYLIPKWEFQRGVIPPPNTGLVWMQYFFALPGIPACTVKRTVFEKVGYFPEFLKQGEDAAFLSKCGLELPVFFDDYIVGRYIRHRYSTISIRNTTQSPAVSYYYQRKHFYVPYVLKRYTDNPVIVRTLSQVVATSLFSCAFIKRKDPIGRATFVYTEGTALRVQGWGSWYLLTTIVVSVLFPKRLSRYLLWIALRLIYA